MIVYTFLLDTELERKGRVCAFKDEGGKHSMYLEEEHEQKH